VARYQARATQKSGGGVAHSSVCLCAAVPLCLCVPVCTAVPLCLCVPVCTAVPLCLCVPVCTAVPLCLCVCVCAVMDAREALDEANLYARFVRENGVKLRYVRLPICLPFSLVRTLTHARICT
jgi:hypothetical protein